MLNTYKLGIFLILSLLSYTLSSSVEGKHNSRNIKDDSALNVFDGYTTLDNYRFAFMFLRSTSIILLLYAFMDFSQPTLHFASAISYLLTYYFYMNSFELMGYTYKVRKFPKIHLFSIYDGMFRFVMTFVVFHLSLGVIYLF